MSLKNRYGSPMGKDAADRGRAFADLIRNARKAHGWTQDTLIEESGVTKSTLVRWESGRAERPDPDAVRALCRALDIDPLQAAVALGYLTMDDIRPGMHGRQMPEPVKEALDILEDPAVPDADKQKWIAHLRYLRDLYRRGRENGAAAS